MPPRLTAFACGGLEKQATAEAFLFIPAHPAVSQRALQPLRVFRAALWLAAARPPQRGSPKAKNSPWFRECCACLPGQGSTVLNLSRASRYAVLRTLDRPARDAEREGQSTTQKENIS